MLTFLGLYVTCYLQEDTLLTLSGKLTFLLFLPSRETIHVSVVVRVEFVYYNSVVPSVITIITEADESTPLLQIQSSQHLVPFSSLLCLCVLTYTK